MTTGASSDRAGSGARRSGALFPLAVALVTTAGVTAVSYGLPEEHAATGVGVVFLAVTYALVLRHDAETVRAHGLSMGGLLEPEPVSVKRVARDAGSALGWALATAAVVLPPFWLGWLWYWKPESAFAPSALRSTADDALGQWLVIALPEEAFYRGYLQSALDASWPRRVSLFGAKVGPALLVTSALFAIGHLATDLNPNRLAVFFPALVFGWLRARTGGIGASVVFHALCNLFASYLARSYGFSG